VTAPLCPAHPAERLAGRDPQLLADEVDARRQLGHRMLDLQPRVQLDEVEAPARPEQELERAGVAVLDRAAGLLGGRLHLLARLRSEGRRRRFLDQLLVAALDRALALAEGEHATLGVGENLDLDVPCRDDRLLEVEARVAEGGLGLGRRGRVGILELLGPVHEAHALAAPAGDRLQQHGIAGITGCRLCVRQRGCLVGAGDDGHSGGAHLALRHHLVAHARHRLGGRADKDEVVLVAGRGEGRVLGEEAPARMDGVAPVGRGRRDERRDLQVAVGSGRRPDADGAVGEAGVQRPLVGGRVHGDGFDAELVQ
jgi:hypothetical protein